MLDLFYITNDAKVAKIAEASGVDRIFVDMEYIGKDQRQPNMDTVKNHHTVEDVRRLRKVLKEAELLVRVNPIHDGSEKEIDEVIRAGADRIMLPMWKSVEEVESFLEYTGGRIKNILLLETDEAVRCADNVLRLDGVDEIHIGLNDLHLSQGKKFLFELLCDGTVDELAEKMKAAGMKFGFGGIGAVSGNAPLPAKNVIAEHYRLGSQMAILSRAFCNTSVMHDYADIQTAFQNGLRANREYEQFLSAQNPDYFEAMHQETAEIIKKIVG